jgi:hypothetical protein
MTQDRIKWWAAVNAIVNEGNYLLGVLRYAVWCKFTHVSEVLAAWRLIALMMEAASISEMSVNV